MDAEEGQAEFEPHRLLEQDGDAPGRQQGVEQTAVETAHDDALDHEPDQGRHDEGDRNREKMLRPSQMPASTVA